MSIGGPHEVLPSHDGTTATDRLHGPKAIASATTRRHLGYVEQVEEVHARTTEDDAPRP